VVTSVVRGAPGQQLLLFYRPLIRMLVLVLDATEAVLRLQTGEAGAKRCYFSISLHTIQMGGPYCVPPGLHHKLEHCSTRFF